MLVFIIPGAPIKCCNTHERRHIVSGFRLLMAVLTLIAFQLCVLSMRCLHFQCPSGCFQSPRFQYPAGCSVCIDVTCDVHLTQILCCLVPHTNVVLFCTFVLFCLSFELEAQSVVNALITAVVSRGLPSEY